MSVVLQLAEDHPTPTCPDQDPPKAGMWLARFDPEFGQGAGAAWFTADEVEALHWPEPLEAFNFWRTQPANRPLRPDGQPNRPLTALTVVLAPASEHAEALWLASKGWDAVEQHAFERGWDEGSER